MSNHSIVFAAAIAAWAPPAPGPASEEIAGRCVIAVAGATDAQFFETLA